VLQAEVGTGQSTASGRSTWRRWWDQPGPLPPPRELRTAL